MTPEELKKLTRQVDETNDKLHELKVLNALNQYSVSYTSERKDIINIYLPECYSNDVTGTIKEAIASFLLHDYAPERIAELQNELNTLYGNGTTAE